MQGGVLSLVPKIGQAVGDGLIPIVHAILFDGFPVNLGICDGGKQLSIIHGQVKAEGERVRFAGVVQTLVVSRNGYISCLKSDSHVGDERVCNGGADRFLQFLLGDGRLHSERAIVIASDVCFAGAG